jgi:1-acyl-sn-glycerol-3-phosphate acyltransferase
MDKSSQLRLDVKGVLKEKNPSLAAIMPGFLLNYLKRIVHQDELNELLEKHGHLHDAELIGEGLNFLKIKYTVIGAENLPAEGRYIFAANHPLGGLDGLVFIRELSGKYKSVKFPVNDILLNIKNLSGVFLPVNKHGAQGRDAARQIEEAYASDCQILYFPAGLCSRKRKGVISDLKWHKSFITKAIQHKRDVVPAYFSGRNSGFFYNLSNLRNLLGIKANIEMLYLADEMFRQKDKEIFLVFGKPVPWTTFDKSRTPDEWALYVRELSYGLESSLNR